MMTMLNLRGLINVKKKKKYYYCALTCKTRKSLSEKLSVEKLKNIQGLSYMYYSLSLFLASLRICPTTYGYYQIFIQSGEAENAIIKGMDESENT